MTGSSALQPRLGNDELACMGCIHLRCGWRVGLSSSELSLLDRSPVNVCFQALGAVQARPALLKEYFLSQSSTKEALHEFLDSCKPTVC